MTLERRGVDLAHIVAWLGDDEPDECAIEALHARGVEARFGMFGDATRTSPRGARRALQSVAVE